MTRVFKDFLTILVIITFDNAPNYLCDIWKQWLKDNVFENIGNKCVSFLSQRNRFNVRKIFFFNTY